MKRIEFHKESLVMQRVIHGPNKSHPSAATSLTNLACAYHEFVQLQTALVMREQSLDMERSICVTYAAHLEIVYPAPTSHAFAYAVFSFHLLHKLFLTQAYYL